MMMWINMSLAHIFAEEKHGARCMNLPFPQAIFTFKIFTTRNT